MLTNTTHDKTMSLSIKLWSQNIGLRLTLTSRHTYAQLRQDILGEGGVLIKKKKQTFVV